MVKPKVIPKVIPIKKVKLDTRHKKMIAELYSAYRKEQDPKKKNEILEVFFATTRAIAMNKNVAFDSNDFHKWLRLRAKLKGNKDLIEKAFKEKYVIDNIVDIYTENTSLYEDILIYRNIIFTYMINILIKSDMFPENISQFLITPSANGEDILSSRRAKHAGEAEV